MAEISNWSADKIDDCNIMENRMIDVFFLPREVGLQLLSILLRFVISEIFSMFKKKCFVALGINIVSLSYKEFKSAKIIFISRSN